MIFYQWAKVCPCILQLITGPAAGSAGERENMEANEIISTLVFHYHQENNLALEYEGEKDIQMAFIFRRNGIYDALLAIADYDEETVIDWLNAGVDET